MARVPLLALALLLAGCVEYSPHVYDQFRAIGHPTMTDREISFGVGARVRAVSEGATASQRADARRGDD